MNFFSLICNYIYFYL